MDRADATKKKLKDLNGILDKFLLKENKNIKAKRILQYGNEFEPYFTDFGFKNAEVFEVERANDADVEKWKRFAKYTKEKKFDLIVLPFHLDDSIQHWIKKNSRGKVVVLPTDMKARDKGEYYQFLATFTRTLRDAL